VGPEPADPANPRSTPAVPAGVSVSVSAPPSAPAAAESPSARAVAVQARNRRLAEVGVLAVVLVWAANFVVLKAAFTVLGPLTVTSARFVVAALTLFLLVRWRTGAIQWPGRLGWPLIGLGMLGFGCYQVVWSLGLTRITAGESALLIAVAPVLTALLAGAVGMDRLTGPKLAGALTAFAGVVVVIGAGHGLSLGASLVGDLLTLIAAVIWPVYTILGARMLRHVEPLQTAAWSVFGGALLLLPFGAWEVMTSPAVAITPAAIAGVLLSGMFAVGVANVVVFNAIRLIGPTRVSLMQFLTPACAVALGAIFLAEPVGIAQVVGGAIIVLGVWLTRRRTVIPARVRERLRTS
jgi:drug/metabolite transporter (DMT)-like permease